MDVGNIVTYRDVTLLKEIQEPIDTRIGLKEGVREENDYYREATKTKPYE